MGFMIWRTPGGTSSCNKHHLLAKGFRKTDRIVYTKTFNFVVKPTTILLLFFYRISNGGIWATVPVYPFDIPLLLRLDNHKNVNNLISSHIALYT